MIAVEITAAVDAAGTLQTFYVGDAQFVTGAADTPAHTVFDPALIDPGSISISAFGDARTGGATSLSLGQVTLDNTDGRYDGWLDYGFDGRSIIIRRGEPGTAYPGAFTEVFSGTMAGTPLVTRKQVVIRLRDRQFIFQRPAISTTYAGTNVLPDGLEGTEADIKGQVKPRMFGPVTNISPPLVNTSKQILQVNNGNVFRIDAVYDRGAPIAFGVDWPTGADLIANAPDGDRYDTCISEGLVRIGPDILGQITVDATQGVSASERTAAQILKALAISAGVLESEISAEDVVALDAANPAEVGVWINTDETFVSVMDRVAGSIGAFYCFDQSGVFRMGRLTAPEGDADLVIEEEDAFEPFERRPARDGNIPVWRVTVRYAKNWTVQESDLAASVDPARRARLASEWRSVVVEDASIKEKHPLAEEWVVDTLLTSEADALAEAQRLFAIYRVRCDFFDVGVTADNLASSGAWIMGQVSLVNPRFGLSEGRLFRLLGIKPELKTNKATLSLWGPVPTLDEIAAYFLALYGESVLFDVFIDPLDVGVNVTYPEFAEV